MEKEIDELRRGDIVEFVGSLFKLKVVASYDPETANPSIDRNKIHQEDNVPHFLARSVEMIGHESAPEFKHKLGRYSN